MKYIFFIIISFSLFAKINYSFKEIVSTNENPEIEFISDVDLEFLKVKIKKNGKTFINKNYKNLEANKKNVIILKQKRGIYKYKVVFTGKHKNDAKKINNTLKLKGIKLKELDIYLKKADINLENAFVKLSSNRKIVKSEVEIYDLEKKLIYSDTINYKSAKKKNIKIYWKKLDSQKISSIQIKIYDKYNFYSGLELNPFSVDIPHEEIVFKSGKYDIANSEIHKIKNTFKYVKKAIDKYGNNLTLDLYIAGYTDTVGNSGDNLILSKNRAKSIARAFRKEGLNIKILYQGFGEEVLRVKTKDNVDEEKNRRAIYILSTHKPPISKVIPKDKWHILK